MNKLKTFIGDKAIKLFWKKNCRLTPMYQERICDYPFVLRRLKTNDPCKILDCGSSNDLMVPFLCSLGYEVYGIDKKEGVDINFVKNYPNYHFSKNDLRNIPFSDEFFDISICISTLEHIFDDQNKVPEDWKALSEIIRVTKSKGQIIFTSPYGKGKINTVYPKFPHKIFDEESLNLLLNMPQYKDKIKVNEMAFFKKENIVWRKASKEETAAMDCSEKVQGLVCVDSIRK